MTETRDLAYDTVDDLATTLHNNDAEADVLGGILHNPRTLDDVTLTLTPEHFYQPANELIYHAIVALYSRGRPVDITTVADQLGPSLPRAGGTDRLRQLHYRGTGIVDPAWHAHIVADAAARRRLDVVGTRIRQLARTGDGSTLDLFDAAAAEIAAIPRTVPGVDEATTTSWASTELAAILEHGEILEQPTLLERTDGQCLLYPQAVHWISGEPETGKTWVALIAAVQILRDREQGRHVTYVDFEDRAGRVVPRLIHLGAPRDAILERFHYIRPTDALRPSDRKHLDRAAGLSTLAVLDGATEAMTMHGLDIQDNADTARYLDLLPRHLADQDCTVLQIDHVVKDADSRGRYAIGAQHKLAGLDGVSYGIKIRQPFARGKLGRATITVHKDRNGAIREAALGQSIAQLVIDAQHDAMTAYLEQPTTIPTTASGDLRPTHLMEKVSDYVQGSPGATRSQIEKGVHGKRDLIRAAIDALVSEGFLMPSLGLRGAQHHSVIAAYREEEDGAA